MLNHKAFRLFSVAIATVLLLPPSVRQGMFLDGVSYACIARNMAEGLGDFTHPHYTATLYPVCHEQPPLVFWLQSLFFRVFGDHFWVERMYALMAAALTAGAMTWHYRSVQKAENESLPTEGGWLPVLIWAAMPIVFWAYPNNMLECTMAVFSLLAADAAIRYLNSSRLYLLALSGAWTFAAVLSKGPVGFFTLAAPLLGVAAFQPEKWRKGLVFSGASALFTAVFFSGMLFLAPEMNDYLSNYLHTRLLPTLSGTRDEAVSNRWHFLVDLFSQLAPAILLTAVLAWRGLANRIPRQSRYFFAMGLAGTLPLVFSPKQSTHYLLPSLPFFALGFGALFLKAFQQVRAGAWAQKWQQWFIFPVSGLLLGGSLFTAVSGWGKYRRDQGKIEDVTAVSRVVQPGSVIGAPPGYSTNWTLIAYLGRLGKISLDDKQVHGYFLADKNAAAPVGYSLIAMPTTLYNLWKKN